MSQTVLFNAFFANLKLAKNNVIQLELPESLKDEILIKIMKMRRTDVIVQFGDPQVSMQFDEDDRQDELQRTGLLYQAGPSGLVENVQRSEEGDLLDFPGVEEPGQEESGGEEQEPEEHEDDENNEESEGESDDIEGKADPADVDQETVDKQELENFILVARPKFEEIPFDFPTLLERKREGDTWMTIASELNVSSSRLSTAYGDYKKRVAKMIKGGGAA